MSYLQQATKPQVKPPFLIISGHKGAGKSTLGALFPKPVFLRAEDGTAVFESWNEDRQPILLPVINKPTGSNKRVQQSSKMEVMAQLDEILTAEHDFQTLVIDTVTSMNELFEDEIAIESGVETVADAAGGFHKGYDVLKRWHTEVIDKLLTIREVRKMTIVLLTHTGVRKIKLDPQQAMEYSVFTIGVHERSAEVYSALADAILFIDTQKMVIGAKEDQRRGTQTKVGGLYTSGERFIITSSDGKQGYASAKSRYSGMPTDIPLEHGRNPLLQYIPYFQQQFNNNKQEG